MIYRESREGRTTQRAVSVAPRNTRAREAQRLVQGRKGARQGNTRRLTRGKYSELQGLAAITMPLELQPSKASTETTLSLSTKRAFHRMLLLDMFPYFGSHAWSL